VDIAKELKAFDTKNRNFYDNLTALERKDFSNFLMIRWGATVTGSADIQQWYLMATNQRLNKHFFNINSKTHAKLHWLMASTVSPGMGTQRHEWIGMKKKEAGKNKIRKFLESQYPMAKSDEIDLLIKLNDTATIKQLAKSLGLSAEQIKKELT